MMQGRIISAHGRHYVARVEEQLWHCYTRGKRAGICVGDYVDISPQGQNEARIEKVHERKSLLYRSDEMRSKQFAANVDVLLFITAVEPKFSDDLLGRALTAAWNEHVRPYIVLNKIDIQNGLEEARARLQPYRRLGVEVIECSTTEAEDLVAKLLPMIKGQTALLLGQSAMGKSSILNVLVPDANAHTQAHSQALGAGRHTTTKTELYDIRSNGEIIASLIDSPGFQNFGLLHLSDEQIVKGFPEFSEAIQHCRFYNCRHLQEPGCGVIAALEQGQIHPERHELYKRIIAENEAAQRW
ncbi:Small ribosomal subunit biogenesis GTPase RsgA [Oligella sp. MSHR50489EDL]|uniref:ribosome small subunit-dependent GTPase A n=1 Tax=Oligella sp. MSHR50489EDL TaxID=3139409 RepID=UPI003D814EF7